MLILRKLPYKLDVHHHIEDTDQECLKGISSTESWYNILPYKVESHSMW